MIKHFNTSKANAFVPCTSANAPGLFEPFNERVPSVHEQIIAVLKDAGAPLISIEINPHTHELRVSWEPGYSVTLLYAGGQRNLIASRLKSAICNTRQSAL